MKVYRVYLAFHDPFESGTREFGLFSSEETAKAIVAKAAHDFPPDSFWAGGEVCLREYVLDDEISETVVGYT